MNKNSLIGAVLLSSVLVTGNNYLRNNGEENTVDSESRKEVVLTDNNYLKNIDLKLEDEKTTIEQEYEKYTICSGTKVYSAHDNGKEIVVDKMMIVSLLEINGKRALIMFENGNYGYTNISSLIKCIDVNSSEYKDINENNMVILNNLTKLYDDSGMYLQSRYPNTLCYAISKNDKYAYVRFEDGLCAYVELSSLNLLTSKIDGYAYVRNISTTYSDKELNNEKGNINAGELVYVIFTSDEYAYVMNNNCECFYMNISDLDKDFIMINLDEQRMYCFLDFHFAKSFGTRSGRDGSPTHTGDFDIDWKVENWEFTTFPGSYALHWIPINEYGEGIHDLIGDDEANYGNDLYHSYGSHGCIRVPAAASQYVYDNYDVGDMVLVRKK